MEMFVELNAHAWYLIFWDLSLDTVHSSLGLMGLDVERISALQKALRQYWTGTRRCRTTCGMKLRRLRRFSNWPNGTEPSTRRGL